MDNQNKSIRETIISNDDVINILDDGDTIIQSIAESHRQILEVESVLYKFKNNGINAIREELAEVENSHSFLIANATDDNNKPLYSNAEKRQGALNESLARDPKYREVKSRLKVAEQKQFELEQAVAEAKIECEYQRNRLSVWRSKAEVAASLSRESTNNKTIRLEV